MTRDEFLSKNPIEAVCASRGIKLIGSGNERKAKCPLHADKNPSFSVNTKTNLWRCFAGCGGGSVIDLLCKLDNLSVRELFEREGVTREERNASPLPRRTPGDFGFKKRRNPFDTRPVKRPPDREPEEPKHAHEGKDRVIECTYPYTNAVGKLLYEVVRYKPKDFRQRHMVDGEWVWNMNGVERVLFQLPAVLQSQRVTVCYAPDTELLTPSGWKFISKIEDGDLIAQWSMDGSAQFVRPSRVIAHEFNGSAINIRADWCDLLVTPEHRLVVKRPRCRIKVIEAQYCGPNSYFPSSGCMQSDQPSPTIDQCRLIAAWQADGMVTNMHRHKAGHHPAWNIKKERKKERLRILLSSLGLEWVEQSYPSCPEWTMFYLRRDDVPWLFQWLPEKKFHWGMLQWNFDARHAIIDEIRYWDGDTYSSQALRFFTSDPQSANVIAAMCAITGCACIHRISDRHKSNCQPEHILNIIMDQPWRACTHQPQAVPLRSKVYCVTVPSGFVVTRRHGKTIIAGNCEGEKDCINLGKLGFVATTNVGGAGKWLDSYSDVLAGKDVIICGDNDPDREDGSNPGRDHVQKVFDSIAGKAKTVKILKLPKNVKDISDYIATFKTPEQAKSAIEEMIAAAHPFVQGYKLPLYSMSEIAPIYAKHARTLDTDSFDMGRLFPGFRRHVRPLVPGEVMLLLGDTGGFKTGLMSNILLAALPLPTLLFELELPAELMFERLVAARMKLRCTEVEDAYRRGEEMAREMLDHEFPNFQVCTESGLTLDDVDNYIARSELKLGEPPKVVAIDYVQIMRGKGNRRERISDIAEGLKVIAKSRRVIIILLSQVARPEEGESEIGLHDAKESSSLESSAGLVIGIWRDDNDKTLLHLKVLKNTKGTGGWSMELNLDGERMLVTERSKIDEKSIPPEPRSRRSPTNDDE